MWPVAVGLSLQSDGAEGAGDVALRSGRRQRGASDVAHLGGDEKRPHTLTVEEERKRQKQNPSRKHVGRSPAGRLQLWHRCVAYLDDDAFVLVLGLQSSREEVHEGLRDIKRSDVTHESKIQGWKEAK